MTHRCGFVAAHPALHLSTTVPMPTIMLLYGALAVAGVSIATAQSAEFTRIAHCQRGDGVQFDHTVAVSTVQLTTKSSAPLSNLFSCRPHALIRVQCRRRRLRQLSRVAFSPGRVPRRQLRGALPAEIFARPTASPSFPSFPPFSVRAPCQAVPAQGPRVAAHGAAQSPPSRPGLCRRSPTWLPARPRSRSVSEIVSKLLLLRSPRSCPNNLTTTRTATLTATLPTIPTPSAMGTRTVHIPEYRGVKRIPLRGSKRAVNQTFG